MPDFERLTRSLELHVARTPEEKAFVQGRHAGLSIARKQVAQFFAMVAIAAVLIFNYAG
jgi:hypothetical protein